MKIDETVFVADGAKIIGDDIEIGAQSNVWYNAVIRSDDGEFVHIGERTNVQDLTMIHTSPGASTTIGDGVSQKPVYCHFKRFTLDCMYKSEDHERYNRIYDPIACSPIL